MANTLYLECCSGISGDMAVGALLDLGADQEKLKHALESLPIDGFEIEIGRVEKAGLDVCDFRVKLDPEHENHDHDMEYLHGKAHDFSGTVHHHLSDARKNAHEQLYGHSMEQKKEHHEHRGPLEILEMIEKAAISDRAKETAGRIIRILADAEAKAHGVPVEKVHFHEVGAVDSIVDIIAFAVCMDHLDITEVIVPELYEGRGFVRCQHGMIPVPVPAVVNIAQAYEIPLHVTDTEGELVTPTGAAFAAAVRTSDRLPEKFRIKKIGMGAGKRTYDRPSLLRAMLIEDGLNHADMTEDAGIEKIPGTIYKLETNIDDCNGESLGYVMKLLFEAGARDVHYTPVFMKKNRPAYQLNVICGKKDVPKMEEIIFRETTTIGIRKMEMERTVLKREIVNIQTSLGEAEVKVCRLPDGETRCYPEYESVIKLAELHGICYQEAYAKVRSEAEA